MISVATRAGDPVEPASIHRPGVSHDSGKVDQVSRPEELRDAVDGATRRGGDVRQSGFSVRNAGLMTTERRDYRSLARVRNPFLISPQDRRRLEAEMASEEHQSLQQLLETRVWGGARPRRRSGPQPQDEGLDEMA